MVRVQLEFIGHEFHELALDLLGTLPGCETGAVGHPEDVGVDGDRRLAERDVEHDVRRLAADARQPLQRFAVGRDLAVVVAQQYLGQRDDVLRLVPEEPDRLDVGNQPVDAQGHDCRRRVGDRIELRGRLVHALVRRLRGEHDGDQQLERRPVGELGPGMRVAGPQALEDRAAFLRIHGLAGVGGRPAATAARRASRGPSFATRWLSSFSAACAFAAHVAAVFASPRASAISASSSYT